MFSTGNSEKLNQEYCQLYIGPNRAGLAHTLQYIHRHCSTRHSWTPHLHPALHQLQPRSKLSNPLTSRIDSWLFPMGSFLKMIRSTHTT
jgi:hypothetical protein